MPNAKTDADFTILETALDLAGERSWQEISLTDIAEASGKPLSALYSSGGKPALSKQIEAWGDLAMSETPSDSEDSPRERLFDVIMRRFEQYEARRAGVVSLMNWRDGSPKLRAELLRARTRSANWALACAKLDTLGPLETRLTGLGLAWVIGQTTRAWRQDEGGDFARTMATLDAELINAEERLDALKRFAPKPRSGPQPDTADSTAKAAESDAPEAPRAASDQD